MHDLKFGLKMLCDRNQDGSPLTRYNRERILLMIADQLQEAGFKKMTP
jgi:hypothetical protein